METLSFSSFPLFYMSDESLTLGQVLSSILNTEKHIILEWLSSFNSIYIVHVAHHLGFNSKSTFLAKVLDYNMVYSQGLPNDKKVG